jgi:hypothetical protein
MKKAVITFLVALALPAVGFAAETMRDGYWELTTTMEIPGTPMKIPPSLTKHCYTKEDVKDQKKTIATNKDCTVTELNDSGNKVTWKMICTGQSAGESSGVTIFKGDSYETTMKMQTQGQVMEMNIKAKRLGDCP